MQCPGTTTDITSAQTGQRPSTRRAAPGWQLRELLCAGQHPQGSTQALCRSPHRARLRPCSRYIGRWEPAEPRLAPAARQGFSPGAGGKSTAILQECSTGNIVPIPPPKQAASLSVLHQTSREAIRGCPVELDHLGPVQGDA